MTGRDLTIDQVVQVARYGAKVGVDRRRPGNAPPTLTRLLLEAAAEGVSVYWFNRGSGSGRERFIFTGDPCRRRTRNSSKPGNSRYSSRGALAGLGPEVGEEEIVRAMMVVRANTMSFEAASPQLTQRLLDLLNDRITPVVQSRGTVGEGDLGPFTNVGATMVGAGNAYYRGVRMPAAAGALKSRPRRRSRPSVPTTANSRAPMPTPRARLALLLYDAREALVLGGSDLRHRS